jgi:hypothetical protein
MNAARSTRVAFSNRVSSLSASADDVAAASELAIGVENVGRG